MLSHVTVGTNDIARSRAFYDPVMASLGLKLVDEGDDYAGYAKGPEELPWFWVLPTFDGAPASHGNGTHFAFLAASRAQVDEFHRVALAAGGSDEGAPGPRPHYTETYYGAYVRDPDGNKLQAVCHAAP